MGRKKVTRIVDYAIKSKKALLGGKGNNSEFVNLSFDELEALRLCDLNGLYQDEAAKKMDISRATFARILFEARRKAAEAIIKGFPVKLSKGNVKFEKEKMNCPIHKSIKRKGRICLCKIEKGKYNVQQH